MTAHAVVVPAIAAACLGASASAAITLVYDASAFNAGTVGMQRSVESFSSFTDGSYASPLQGSTGPVTWQATASQGLRITSGRLASVNGQELLISFQAGTRSVQGVSGDFLTSVGSTITAATILVQMNDGTSFMQAVANPGTFLGFLSSGASISSIRISLAAGSTAVDPTVDNLDFATIPAPGSITLLATSLVSFATRRRR